MDSNEKPDELNKKCQIVFQPESAYQLVAELNELGSVQFIDLNKKQALYEKKFTNRIKKCEEIEQKIDCIESEIKKHHVRIDDFNGYVHIPEQKEMINLEDTFESVHNDIIQNKQNTEDLLKNRNQLIELKTILDNINGFGLKQDVHEKTNGDNRLEFLTGIIKNTNNTAKTTFLRRISRAQVFAKTIPIQKKNTMVPHHSEEAFVFILFFSGEKQRDKVKKICDGFHSKCYTIPEESDDRRQMMRKVSMQIDQMKGIIKKALDYRMKVIRFAANNLNKWKIMNQKLESVYRIMNMFHAGDNLLVAECWISGENISQVDSIFQNVSSGSKSAILTVLKHK